MNKTIFGFFHQLAYNTSKIKFSTQICLCCYIYLRFRFITIVVTNGFAYYSVKHLNDRIQHLTANKLSPKIYVFLYIVIQECFKHKTPPVIC